jgi:hypothetical protein
MIIKALAFVLILQVKNNAILNVQFKINNNKVSIMKKKNLFKRIYFCFKKIRYYYEDLKNGPVDFRVDFGGKRN